MSVCDDVCCVLKRAYCFSSGLDLKEFTMCCLSQIIVYVTVPLAEVECVGLKGADTAGNFKHDTIHTDLWTTSSGSLRMNKGRIKKKRRRRRVEEEQQQTKHQIKN